MNAEDKLPKTPEETLPATDSAIARAIAHGVDITLLERNLRMTMTERVRQADDARDFVLELQAEARRWRTQQTLDK